MTSELVKWRDALIAAIEERQIQPVFQPVWTIDGTLMGFEALTRFPNGSPPDRVWALAEDQGLVEQLDAVALTAAVQDAQTLPGKLFLNIGALYLAWIMQWEHGTDPARIIWEVTETDPLTPDGAATVGRLKNRGYAFALDDAGTGYATPHQLYALQPQVVKLSLNMVHQWHRGHVQPLQLWIRAAHAMGATVVAEGMEDRAWLSTLAAEGVDAIQGYAMGKPQPAASWQDASRMFKK
ncbi:EAL domain-containing protein [Sulfobacillus thermosulfidooxidans]|uniref:EAL domain-containing protein n=1 Tax=Sulfobacillus thermosulfidooxidans TaxID=28034 RepID=UPI0006B50A18|nr:EAL domain-containing protein [Sulfobacillus thermosulfidooxidans]